MELLQGYYRGDPEERNTAIDTLITTRNDVVAVTCYDEEGTPGKAGLETVSLRRMCSRICLLIRNRSMKKEKFLFPNPM